ncbi:hypothetical protein OESDEN_06233 [Oesophagostomum dentatum]|uniref:Uncharacterized protein n=1 Tax=Oesophagostomum dentatum TaxID=61180 RepID=A0A0B1TDD7_OESDE|nr:hypothetical protein OESDEN_06233 [Oesophagostomum dentatum]
MSCDGSRKTTGLVRWFKLVLLLKNYEVLAKTKRIPYAHDA